MAGVEEVQGVPMQWYHGNLLHLRVVTFFLQWQVAIEQAEALVLQYEHHYPAFSPVLGLQVSIT